MLDWLTSVDQARLTSCLVLVLCLVKFTECLFYRRQRGGGNLRERCRTRAPASHSGQRSRLVVSRTLLALVSASRRRAQARNPPYAASSSSFGKHLIQPVKLIIIFSHKKLAQIMLISPEVRSGRLYPEVEGEPVRALFGQPSLDSWTRASQRTRSSSFDQFVPNYLTF